MQVLQAQFPAGAVSLEDATLVDAPFLAKLYADVYNGEYPCPELFTAEGMAEFLDFTKSHVITLKITLGLDIIGCVSCELKGRAAYLRGGMIAPQWQGKVRAGSLFTRAFEHFHELFGKSGIADYFYAETRTGNAKFHQILRPLGYAAYAILPRKDVFAGRRESEVVHARYFHPPAVGALRLTPRAALVASMVLKIPVRPAQVLPLVTPHMRIPSYCVHVSRDPNGDEHWELTGTSGTPAFALFCPASLEVEKVAIEANSIGEYQVLVACVLVEARQRGAEYVEVYAPATAPGRQAALEALGFSPVGFLPQWYAPGTQGAQDCVAYAINFTSILPECTPNLIPCEEFLRSLVPDPVVDGENARLAPLLVKKIAAPAPT